MATLKEVFDDFIDGKKIRCKDWAKKVSIDNTDIKYGTISLYDLVSTEWEVVPKDKKTFEDLDLRDIFEFKEKGCYRRLYMKISSYKAEVNAIDLSDFCLASFQPHYSVKFKKNITLVVEKR